MQGVQKSEEAAKGRWRHLVADVIAVPQWGADRPTEMAAVLVAMVYEGCGVTLYTDQHPGPVTQEERAMLLFRIHEYLQFGRR